MISDSSVLSYKGPGLKEPGLVGSIGSVRALPLLVQLHRVYAARLHREPAVRRLLSAASTLTANSFNAMTWLALPQMLPYIIVNLILIVDEGDQGHQPEDHGNDRFLQLIDEAAQSGTAVHVIGHLVPRYAGWVVPR